MSKIEDQLKGLNNKVKELENKIKSMKFMFPVVNENGEQMTKLSGWPHYVEISRWEELSHADFLRILEDMFDCKFQIIEPSKQTGAFDNDPPI